MSTTIKVLRMAGSNECEAVVLWLGTIDGSTATVTHAYVPAQTPIREEEGVGYFVDSAATMELNDHLVRVRQRLIAQVHSHPGRAYHSSTDDRYAIVSAEGGVSLVAPDFGRVEYPTRWAVYRLLGGTWTLLTTAERDHLIKRAP